MKPVPQGPLDGNAPKAARTRRIVAVVVSSDDGLIIDLGPVLGDRYRTRPIDSIDDLATNPVDGDWLIILDAVADPEARARAARLETQFPSTPLIAIVAGADSAQWAAALARGGVVGIVPRGRVDKPDLQQALLAAELRLREHAAPTITLPTAPGTLGRRLSVRLIAGLIAALLAATVAWYLRWDNPATAPVPHPAPAANAGAATTTAASGRSALELLSAARIAFASQRQLPRADADLKGDSALELYVQAITIDPKNEEARDGVRRLFTMARARVQSDITTGRFDEAARLMDLFRVTGMEADAVAGIDAEIAAARRRWLAARAQETIASGDLPAAEQALAALATGGADAAVLQELQQALEARRQDIQLQEMATAVHASIAAGNLFEPLADNARTRLQAMRQINRTHTATLAAQREYADALLARAQEASHTQQFDAAQRYLSAAGDVATPDEVAVAHRQVQADMDAAAQRAAAAAAAAAAQSAQGTTAAGSTAPAIVDARPTRPLAVGFPPQALAQRLSGFVVIEFTLRADGRASDIGVAESQPAGVFDQSAIDGVAKGRFDTSVLGTGRKPVRARIRVTFK